MTQKTIILQCHNMDKQTERSHAIFYSFFIAFSMSNEAAKRIVIWFTNFNSLLRYCQCSTLSIRPKGATALTANTVTDGAFSRKRPKFQWSSMYLALKRKRKVDLAECKSMDSGRSEWTCRSKKVLASTNQHHPQQQQQQWQWIVPPSTTTFCLARQRQSSIRRVTRL